jgi:hypothetical protein
MDEKSVKELVYEELHSKVTQLETADESKRVLLISDIERLTKVYAEFEKLEVEKEDKDRRFREEIRRADLERDYRDMLERDKLSFEKAKFEENLKTQDIHEKQKAAEEKRNGWRDFGVKVAGVVIPSAISVVFLTLGLKLEFLDNGSVCSFTVKELMKRIVTPKIV